MSERSRRIQKRIVTYGGSRLINLKTTFVQGTVSAKVIKFKCCIVVKVCVRRGTLNCYQVLRECCKIL